MSLSGSCCRSSPCDYLKCPPHYLCTHKPTTTEHFNFRILLFLNPYMPVETYILGQWRRKYPGRDEVTRPDFNKQGVVLHDALLNAFVEKCGI
ncbi:hypothetical protein NPIL_417691 [Nephila pilipes]|uniref:Uncharacterized protein n=1 Tax=Nephila pilipes TaxID=299642 RepID=A0A8X6U0T0_NEPPI|nr:hypothetical protein NPIL_652021 [Nephila pilipes]GFT78130.1 hypothetical protein NPIL_667411 [Nephila pilipes]GFU24722.1 hypothetical protein NPIL_671341 [Nephila pilipes]GFU39246.1 hypothetical protein NPIL_417691 [Nephila pilipes]